MAAELRLIEDAVDNAELIRTLEGYLEKAKSGELTALAVAAVSRTNRSYYNLVRTTRGSLVEVVAAASMAQHAACRAWEDRAELGTDEAI